MTDITSYLIDENKSGSKYFKILQRYLQNFEWTNKTNQSAINFSNFNSKLVKTKY